MSHSTVPIASAKFPEQLMTYMRRIRASAAGIASEIGMSREAVNNWRLGTSMPSRKNRAQLRACARYLRLTEIETNQFLIAAGFEAEFPVPDAIEIASPGAPNKALRALPALATTPFAANVEALFERLAQLAPYAILMLLSQAHWGQPPCRAAILAKAAERFGPENVLHLQPPYSLGDAQAYFSALGRQCGMPQVDSDFSFEQALDQRLRGGGALFCLVSRFEQGQAAHREAMAGILRSLSEMYAGQLHLILCGGAALADLKYQSGDLSLLNIASTHYWPELQKYDVRAMAANMALPPATEASLDAVLLHAGGHPLLTEFALRWFAAHPEKPEQLAAQLTLHPCIFDSFLTLLQNPATRERLQSWLQQSRVAPMRPYLLDPALRAAFWENLLAVRVDADGSYLYWRSDAIRLAGINLLAQI